jgi:tetratricopeptide (TPR) repeat protein
MAAPEERTCVVKAIPRPIGDDHGGRRGHALLVGAIGVLAAVVLAACGGPSAGESADKQVTAGIAAQRAGDYGIARTDYQQALREEPQDVYALYDLGDVEQYQHDDTAAAKHYQEALAVNPHYEYALYNLAILDTSSDPAAAKALYVEVIQQYPRDAVAHFNLGKVELHLHELKAGLAQIDLAVAIEPALKKQAPGNS